MSRLKKIRTGKNLSQEQLSIKSHVKLRLIQAYEQRYRNINKANGDNLSRLATALGCKIEDLLEDDPCSRTKE
jgi:transcriptional regulator with XRE-family HTH domain